MNRTNGYYLNLHRHLLIAACLLTGFTAWAQPPGVVTGKFFEKDGATPLIGVNVTLQYQADTNIVHICIYGMACASNLFYPARSKVKSFHYGIANSGCHSPCIYQRIKYMAVIGQGKRFTYLTYVIANSRANYYRYDQPIIYYAT